MSFLQAKPNHLKKILPPSEFSKLGLTADYSAKDTVKISRGGRPLGHIRKSIGKFVWHPADKAKTQFFAFTAAKALSGLAQRI